MHRRSMNKIDGIDVSNEVYFADSGRYSHYVVLRMVLARAPAPGLGRELYGGCSEWVVGVVKLEVLRPLVLVSIDNLEYRPVLAHSRLRIGRAVDSTVARIRWRMGRARDLMGGVNLRKGGETAR